MAAAFLFGVAGKLLGELGSPALKELGLVWGAKNELQKLKNTVSTIKAVLLDAEEKQTQNREIKDWLGKLEVALYEADDLLDDFSIEGLKRKVLTRKWNKRAKKVRVFFSRSNQLAFRVKMGHKIKGIRENLDAIAADRTKFHLTETLEERVEKKLGITRDFVPVRTVIGREKDKDAIIELLLDSNVPEDVSIIPIVGIGGLGKTTLAHHVYNDEKLVNQFERRMWVCVSDVFDVKLIAQNIIESATKERCKSHQMSEITDNFKMEVDRKKYLLVMDDVWNVDPIKWLEMKELLIGGARGSKILVTTRSSLVAKVVGTVSPYLLNGLSETESWSLFKQIAFKNGEEPENSKHVVIGKEIVKKCVGVPLAIVTVGGLLSIQDTEKEWLDFNEKKLSKIVPADSGIFPILKLSYDSLPPHLKRCFTYCSIFPKDHRIHKRKLIQLWIAQGFVQLSDSSENVENVGDQYFMELLRRSFFQNLETDYLTGEVVCCKIHDLIHDLAQLIVGTEICVIDSDAQEVVATTRHVSVIVGVSDILEMVSVSPFDSPPEMGPPREMESQEMDSPREITTCLREAKKLRTLIIFSDQYFDLRSAEELRSGMMDKTMSDDALSSFKCLRVLDLHELLMDKVPISIGELRHLTYLDLSYNNAQSLPECICQLLHLERLVLNKCINLKNLPRETKNLVSLRHLEIEGCDRLIHMPHGLGQLTSLETLSMFKVGWRSERSSLASGVSPAGLNELEKLINLRGKLRICGLRGSIVEGNGLHGLTNRKEAERRIKGPNAYYLNCMKMLESLKLNWGDDDSVYWVDNNLELMVFESLRPHPSLKKLEIESYQGMDFPSWMMVDIVLFLPNLVEISLFGCDECQRLPRFGLLPSVRVLKLEHMDSLEYIYEEEEEENCGGSSSGDPSSSSSLKARGLFPSLERLCIRWLEKLKGLGSRRRREEGVTQHFPSLVYLDFYSCPMLDFSGDDDENSSQFQTLGTLTSLRVIVIKGCESLTSLPDSMRQLTALKRLIVGDCSPLILRCRQETGEDWPKIAHIQHIDLREYDSEWDWLLDLSGRPSPVDKLLKL